MRSGAAAQSASAYGRSEIFVDSDLEQYLRYLQTESRVPIHPWSIRAFSPLEVDSLAPRTKDHPWATRYELAPARHFGPLAVDFVRPTLTLRYNSAFPYGSNDGPIWAGRGLTSLQAGVAA